jgi:hypothetical protein
MTAPRAGYTSSERSKALTRQQWRDLGVCLSLVNVAFLRVWTELLAYTPENTVLMFRPPKTLDYVAVILNVLIGGVVLFTAVTLVRRHPTILWRSVAYTGFFAALVFCANGVRSVLSNRWEILRGQLFKYMGAHTLIAVLAVLLLAFTLLMLRWRRQVVGAIYSLLLILFPFVVFTFAQAGWAAMHPRDISRFENGPPAPKLPVRAGVPRVLWIIFDELDYRLTFTERPRDLELPEFDRLRTESLFSTNAYPPDSATRVSLPALISGKKSSAERLVTVNDIEFQFPGSNEWVKWTSRNSIFLEARKLGVNTALVGWYLPYCRILNDALTRCWWCEIEFQMNSNGDRLFPIAVNQTRSLFETSLFSPFGRSLSVQRKAEQYTEMLHEGVSLSTDPTLGLSLIHFDVPHSPFVYNRRTRDFSLANSPVKGYVDALALTDRTLGDIRRAMEQTGQWDSAAILISADHFYRYSKLLDGKSDRRIPFMLKLPFQKEGTVHTGRFNSIVTKELLLSIIRGELKSAADVDSWLNKHAQDAH